MEDLLFLRQNTGWDEIGGWKEEIVASMARSARNFCNAGGGRSRRETLRRKGQRDVDIGLVGWACGGSIRGIYTGVLGSNFNFNVLGGWLKREGVRLLRHRKELPAQLVPTVGPCSCQLFFWLFWLTISQGLSQKKDGFLIPILSNARTTLNLILPLTIPSPHQLMRLELPRSYFSYPYAVDCTDPALD